MAQGEELGKHRWRAGFRQDGIGRGLGGGEERRLAGDGASVAPSHAGRMSIASAQSDGVVAVADKSGGTGGLPPLSKQLASRVGVKLGLFFARSRLVAPNFRGLQTTPLSLGPQPPVRPSPSELASNVEGLIVGCPVQPQPSDRGWQRPIAVW